MIRMRGSVPSHFATPPSAGSRPRAGERSVPSRAPGSEAIDRLARTPLLAAAVDDGGPRDAVEDGKRDVLAQALRADESLQPAILRDVGDPEVAGDPRTVDHHGLPVDQDLPRRRRRDPEDSEGQLGPSGSDETCDAQDLALPHGQGHVADGAPIGQFLSSSSVLPRGASTLGKSWSIERPTIMEMRAASVTSEMGRVPMQAPSGAP